MKHKFLTYSIMFLAVLLSGCASDDHTPVPNGKATMVLKTRATEWPGDESQLAPEETSADELIRSWWIVFAGKNDGVVKKIVSRSADKTDAVEQEAVEAELPQGEYSVYAFANIGVAQLKAQTGLEFSEGQPLPPGLDTGVWNSLGNDYDVSGNGGVPMSGHRDIKVTGRVQEPFGIEVVRMLAKIEFCFSNISGSDLTVKSVKFGPLNTGAVSLFAPVLASGQTPPILSGCGVEDLTVAFGGGVGLPVATGNDEAVRGKFYVRESVASSHPSGHFHFTLAVERDGRSEEALYAMTDELAYVNRNDYIQIPVVFAEFKVDVEVVFYPPIGGYPAVKVDSNSEEYYITFGTAGSFEIVPSLKRVSDGHVVPSNEMSVKVSVSADPGNILERNPVVESTGEIIGAVGGNEGTALISLEINVKSGEDVSRTYNRKIYIIRK